MTLDIDLLMTEYPEDDGWVFLGDTDDGSKVWLREPHNSDCVRCGEFVYPEERDALPEDTGLCVSCYDEDMGFGQ